MDLQIDYEGHDFARLGIEATQLEGGATRAALATSLVEDSDNLIEVALRAQRDVISRQEDEAFADPSLTQGTIRLEGLDDEAVGEAVGAELISTQLLEGSTEAVVGRIGRLLEELRARHGEGREESRREGC